MGLDMYLTARKYISGWKHNGPGADKLFKQILEAAKVPYGFVDQGAPSGNLEFHIGYWRKANAIHNWFVQNVQDGKDECQKADVSLEQLLTLKEVCENILKLKGDMEKMKVLAQETLPPRAGFFFGSTDVDQWYLRDLEQTIAIIERCEKLAATPKEKGSYSWDFTYQSSW